MIGLVRLALRRPYTMAIAGLLIMLGGVLAVTRMVVDIFPNIDIPVVYVAWNYPGLSAEDMERRVVLVSERAYSTTVNGIERIELFSIPGLGILKVYFNQGTDIGGALSQINAQNNSILRIAPPGITPPNMIRFNASNVPVVQVTLNSKSMPEQQIFDYGLNFLRVRLFTIPGVSIPAPYGGKQRQIIVDVDPARLSSKGLSQMDVVGALQTTNVIVPAGIARIGEREFNVKLNSSPQLVEQFQTLPVGVRDGLMVTLGDVAKVSDSFATQQNAVRINGQRASYMNILKNSDASTLKVVEAVRNLLPDIQATAPDGLELKLDFDQSVFVRGAVENIVHEAILSSILVSLMILVFLGSWRNTVIVSLSIPLSIAAGLAGLFLAGQTINLMTLGGLALAIGLLVDNATVTIENIHRNQGLGKPLTVAILDGSNEVIQPLTVATLAICIVFLPVLLLTGPSRFLFIPLAITVVLAMLASYVLSFTVTPALARYLLKDHDPDPHRKKNIGERMSAAFDRGFERVRNGYGGVLETALGKRKFVLGCFALLVAATGALAPAIGTDFFPQSDVGILKLHVRAPRGSRLEETEKVVARVRAGNPRGHRPVCSAAATVVSHTWRKASGDRGPCFLFAPIARSPKTRGRPRVARAVTRRGSSCRALASRHADTVRWRLRCMGDIDDRHVEMFIGLRPDGVAGNQDGRPPPPDRSPAARVCGRTSRARPTAGRSVNPRHEALAGPAPRRGDGGSSRGRSSAPR